MSIKLVDTLEPMADFPAAMTENIGFADGKTLHKHWQERFHPFRVEYELPIELY